MGAFFTNVQVHVTGHAAAATREQVIAGVRWHVLAGPYRELPASQAGEADRTVLVAPVDAAPWIAVYDQATEGQDVEALVELAQVLSGATSGAALAILVHDSDVLMLFLCRSGQLVDTYVNDPDFFEMSDEERQELAGQPERWSGLLPPHATPDHLRDAWSGDPVFAEELLEPTAELLQLDPARCSTGYDELVQQGVPPDFTRLSFQSDGG